MGQNSNIRIKDIAKMAGVSVGTVDRVIHNRGNVSEKVEKKVKAILQKTNYSPNPIAQSLGSKKNYRIVALIPDPKQDEYWQLSDNGIRQAQSEWEAYNMHIDLKVFDLNDPKSFKQESNKILEVRPDALLTAPVFFDESLTFFKKLQAHDIPYILINTEINTEIKKLDPNCIIGHNLKQSGRVAAELMHIALQNPAEIGVLHIHENIDRSVHLKEKEKGFRNYFKEKSGFKITAHSFLDDEQSFESQVDDFIAQTEVQGIFIPTSSGTFLTAKALEKHNKQAIQLIGYDLLEENIHYLKTGTIDFLINQNPKHQAFQGLRYLVDHLLLNLDIPSSDLLPLEIITRENHTSFLDDIPT